MTIYRVTIWFRGTREYHFAATKREATLIVEAARAEFADAIANENADFQGDIDTVVYPNSRRGMAKALNDFIDLTCINEG